MLCLISSISPIENYSCLNTAIICTGPNKPDGNNFEFAW